MKWKWRRRFLFLAIFIVLLYLLSLVVINTSWAKNKLTTRLKAKTNSEWQVGKVLWVPFGNIELKDLNTSMGEGGVHLESIKVNPSWSDLLTGSVTMEDATVSKANVDLDIQWLKENLSKAKSIDAITKPIPNLEPKKPAPLPQPPVAGKPQPGKPPVRPAPKQTPKQVIVDEPKLNDLPNRWLKIDDLNLTLRNGTRIVEEISGISASIPYAGKPADGEIKFKFQGVEHNHKVSWDGQGLSAEETAGNLYSVNYQWATACRTSQPGMPFMLRFVVPQQKLNHTIDKPNLHWNISSNFIAANFALNGSLRNINTWRGIINAGSGKTVITENQKTHKRVEFDHTRLVGTIANGVFHVPAAEAIGHKVSVLGNGSIYRNLYTYGVIRMVTTDESKRFFDGVYHATRSINIDQSRYHLFFPLDTPDRKYCDIYVDGKLNDLEIRHDRSNSWQPLNIALKKLRDFKNNELQEDGLLEVDQ